MLTYAIFKSKESNGEFLSREQVLDRNLARTFFKVGDVVRFKKPRKPVVSGTIVDIQEKVGEITWGHGGLVPMNIIVEVNGTRVKTNVKRLCF